MTAARPSTLLMSVFVIASAAIVAVLVSPVLALATLVVA